MVGFLGIILQIILPSVSLAGPAQQQCQSASQAAVAACKAAEGGLLAADMARSAAPITSGITNYGNRQKNDTAAQAADVGKALAACQQAEEQCKQQCDQAMQQAQQDAQRNPPGPSAPDVGTIPQTKQSQCIAPLEAEKAKLQQAQNNLNQDSQGSENTEQASNAPPMMPPPQQQQDDSPQQPQEPKPLDCNGPMAARYSACNEQLIARCKGSQLGSSECQTFANRYCNLNSSGSNPSNGGTGGGISIMSTEPHYVVDKKGEGLGSAFCKTAIAFNFCSVGGRDHCPSCLGLQASSSAACITNPIVCMDQNSPETLEKAKATCPADPIFLDPSFLAGNTNPSTNYEGVGNNPAPPPNVGAPPPPVTGGENGGTGGGLAISSFSPMSSLRQNGIDEEGDGIREGESLGPAGRRRGQSSRGGGAGATYSARDVAALRRLASDTAIMPAQRVEGMAEDVSNQFGPSVFAISSNVYKGLCSRGRLMHCQRSTAGWR